MNLSLYIPIHLQIRIKQEKLSDSEENSKLTILSGLENIKRERDESTSDESESESDESESNGRPEETSSSDSEVDVKQEKQFNGAIGKENGIELPLKQIKKEKGIDDTKASATFIPRPIKSEPQSDTEGTSKFKKPASNTSSTSTKPHKRNKNQSSDDVSSFMLSALKIKQEPPSEDESSKRKKRKTTENSKSFESIENDLFDSFLK